MNWVWGNGLPTGIPEPVGYGDGYLFSYPIGYRVGFGYRVLSSGLGMGSILPDPNPTHCHPYNKYKSHKLDPRHKRLTMLDLINIMARGIRIKESEI